MKKMIYFIGLGIILTMFSCNKDNDIANIEKTVDEQQSSLKEQPEGMKHLWWWVEYDLLGDTLFATPIGCFWPPIECLPEVIIYGKGKSDKLLDAYNDFINKFNNNEIDVFFTEGDYLTLFPKLEDMEDVLAGLRTKEIVLHYDVAKETGFDLYIGLPKDVSYYSDFIDDVKCVLQIDNRLN